MTTFTVMLIVMMFLLLAGSMVVWEGMDVVEDMLNDEGGGE